MFRARRERNIQCWPRCKIASPGALSKFFARARCHPPLPPVYRRCPPFLLSQRVPMHWRRDFADAIRSTTTTTTNGTSCMKKVRGTKPRGSVISSRKAKKKRDVDALPRSPSQRNSCWYRAKKLTFTHYTLSLCLSVFALKFTRYGRKQ